MHLALENILTAPIEDGDAGIILKRDGTFKAFSTGTIDPRALDEAQKAQGVKLLALMTALQVPQVMQILLDMSQDPDIVGTGGITIGKPN